MRKYCLALLLLGGIVRPAEKPLPLRWVYISRRLRSDQDVEDIRKLARTASENGLNGVLFAAGLVLCLGTFVLKERAELWWQAAGAVVAVLILTNAL